VTLNITIVAPRGPPLHRFETSAMQGDEPMCLVTGEGGRAVSQDDRVLLQRVAKRRPSRPEGYSQLLAEIHRRAKRSSHPAWDTISEGCVTGFMPPHGWGFKIRLYWDDSASSGRALPAVPQVLSGIDITELSKVLFEHVRATKAGEPVDQDELNCLMAEAGRRAVEPSTS
jgi:hypothetical protein